LEEILIFRKSEFNKNQVGLVTGILFLMQYENAGVRELSLNDSNFT
jgi:hypothetical protein